MNTEVLGLSKAADIDSIRHSRGASELDPGSLRLNPTDQSLCAAHKLHKNIQFHTISTSAVSLAD